MCFLPNWSLTLVPEGSMATVAMQGLGLVGGVKAQSSTFPMSKVLSCWPSLGRMVEGGQPALWEAPAWSGRSRSKHGQGDPALFSFQTESQRLKEEEREKWGWFLHLVRGPIFIVSMVPEVLSEPWEQRWGET